MALTAKPVPRGASFFAPRFLSQSLNRQVYDLLAIGVPSRKTFFSAYRKIDVAPLGRGCYFLLMSNAIDTAKKMVLMDIFTQMEQRVMPGRTTRLVKHYFVCVGSYTKMHSRRAYPYGKARRLVNRAKRMGLDAYMSSPMMVRV